MTPVVTECLVLCGQDRPPLVFEDRADIDAVGKWRVRDVIEACRRIRKKWRTALKPAFSSSARWPTSLSSENVANSTRTSGSSREARTRARARFQPSSAIPRPRRRMSGWTVPQISYSVRPRERPARPRPRPPPGRRFDEDHVDDRVRAVGGVHLDLKALGGRQVRDPVFQAGGDRQLGQPLEVGRVLEKARLETRDRGRVSPASGCATVVWPSWEPPPYLRFMCASTLLWMIFQVRRCSARARGSPSRAALPSRVPASGGWPAVRATASRRRARRGPRSPVRRCGDNR